jgi:hypothetical protein
MIAQRQESCVQFNALTNAAPLAFCHGTRRAVDGLSGNRLLRVEDQRWEHRCRSWQPRLTLGGRAGPQLNGHRARRNALRQLRLPFSGISLEERSSCLLRQALHLKLAGHAFA